jgi:pimeloyl-ACP methyl ester carboxylesterase
MILCLVILAVPAGSLLLAQEPVNRFLIKIRGGALTGSEEYQIEKTGTGYRLTGKSVLNQMGRESELKQEQTVRSDWGFEHYMLQASMMGQTQMIEASLDGQQVKMRAGMGEEAKSKTVPLRPRAIVLDNVIGSHYQVLLNMIGPDAEATGEIFALVPQVLAGVRGRLSAPQNDAGTLNGKPINLRKYTLELANVLTEFWAEAESNRLMRISVPMQNVELVREGFAAAIPAPESKEPSNWVERSLTFPSGSLQMPATLCLPAAPAGHVPVVILVHGSGPQDRDETIGPNKPFRDIAHGLAGAGVATLRYDKRTFAFKPQIDVKTLTLDQEVTDDAVAALEYAKSLTEIGRENVFLLGHSMGGTMAPYIARRFPSLRGVIMMAAAARPLDRLITEQITFQMKVAGSSEADITKRVQDLEGAFARIKSGEATDNDVILRAPAHYWRECFRLDLSAALTEVKIPMLVLQGGKDVQVTRADFDLIEKAMAGLPQGLREMHFMPNLNHLFMEVSGQPTGAEYGRAGAVDREVIGLISAWVLKQTRQ